jgi:Flp pilus assembly pilin Flp
LGSTDTKEQALQTPLGRVVSHQSGTTILQYALIASIVSVAIFSTLGTLGSTLFNTTFELALNSQADR